MAPKSFHLDLDTEVAALSQRVLGIEKSMEGIQSALQAVVGKLDSHSRTPWGALGTWAGVVTTVITLMGASYVAPMKSDIDHLGGILDRAAERMATKDELRSMTSLMAAGLEKQIELEDARRGDLQRQLETRQQEEQRGLEAMRAALHDLERDVSKK